MEHITTRKIAQIIWLGRELGRAERELRGLLEALSEEEAAELTAVMWVGRGSFETDEFYEAFQTALREASTPTADYLIGTPHLTDHLETGLEALGYDVTEEEDAI